MAESKERTISEQLVTKVADQKDTDPRDLHPPLYELVDLEALDALFAPQNGGSLRKTDAHVEFTYDGLRVRVESEGNIDIDDTEEAE